MQQSRDSTFDKTYHCYPVSFTGKSHAEKGDKVILPPSALDQLAYMYMEYPMLFQLSNLYADRVSHCGVLEFIAEEGVIYLPYWMMENMLIQEGGLVNIKNVSLPKGSYIKLQPHTMDFLDVPNPKAVLEATLRRYTCLTTGDSIVVYFNNKNFHISIVETKPSSAICIVDTDCEVDIDPPLDYIEPETTVSLNETPSSKEQESDEMVSTITPFTGQGRRLDGKQTKVETIQPSFGFCSSSRSSALKQHKPEEDNNNGRTYGSNQPSRKGKVISESNEEPALNEKTVVSKEVEEAAKEEEAEEKPKFQAFTGKKYSLKF